MNKLKWYDFLGALILLFSVTKSAIEPPDVTDHDKAFLATSSPTTITKDSHNITPRDASLSQIDTLSPSMSGIFIGNLTSLEVQAAEMSLLPEDASIGGSSPTAKSIPKTALRETHPEWNGSIRVSSRSIAATRALVYYLFDKVKLIGQ